MMRSSPSLILLSLLCLSFSSAQALQVIDARDGHTVMAKMSLREQTRIKIEHGKIAEVVGDVRDQTNPDGRLILIPDVATGDAYIRLADPGNTRPVNLFVKTDKATIGLLLHPVDMPLDTIVLRDRGLAASDSAGAPGSVTPVQTSSNERMPRSAAYVRSIKAMFVAMAGDSVPADVEVRPALREMVLWKESRFTLERQYIAVALVGELYRLTNISAAPMVLAEQEFYKDAVRAVAIELHQLRPGQSTAVYVVRDRSEGE